MKITKTETDAMKDIFPEIRNNEFERPYLEKAYQQARRNLGRYLGVTAVQNQSCDIEGETQPALQFRKGSITRRRTTCSDGGCDYRSVIRISPKGVRETEFKYRDYFCVAL